MSETAKVILCDPPKDKRFKDLSGKAFGRLTVLSFLGRAERNKKLTYWIAQCACGKQIQVCGKDLRIGDVKSCGCIRLEIRTKDDEMPDPESGTKHIPLTRGRFAIVDESDFDQVSKYVWTFDGLYATRNLGGGKMQRLHNFLMPLPKPLEVDHRDKNRLNNRRKNLRVATRSQNGCNRGLQKNNKFGLKGVMLDKRSGKYTSFIVVNKNRQYLGLFKDPESAHEAYKEAATKLHGEFASIQ